jgi:KinB signaling pathway activation protein
MEENALTSRNWVKLFLTALAIGGLTTAIVGFIVRWSEFQPYFTELKILDILSTTIWLIVMGFLFSVVSQMGFFAYLTVHRFGLGIFKSPSLWNGVQVILIVFVLFDFVYLRYSAFAKAGDSLIPYIGLALLILIISLLVAYWKMRQTNRSAFIPALFFMIVATIVEWVPVLRVNESSWLFLMMFALLACNAYQILILHRLNAQSQLERDKLMATKQKKAKQAKKPSVKS